MISSLKSKAVGGLVLLCTFLYWQHVTTQRDSYRAESERQRDRAEILQEHQQWQRGQIETLNTAMVERDRALDRIASDISASTAALERLGETDADARDWLGDWVPGSVDGWVRQLQRTGDADGVPVPSGAAAPNQ